MRTGTQNPCVPRLPLDTRASRVHRQKQELRAQLTRPGSQGLPTNIEFCTFPPHTDSTVSKNKEGEGKEGLRSRSQGWGLVLNTFRLLDHCSYGLHDRQVRSLSPSPLARHHPRVAFHYLRKLIWHQSLRATELTRN